MINVLLISITVINLIILTILIYKHFTKKENYVEDEPVRRRPRSRPSSPESSVQNLTPIFIIRQMLNDLLRREIEGDRLTIQEVITPLNLISEHRYHFTFDTLPEPEKDEIRQILREVSNLMRRSNSN